MALADDAQDAVAVLLAEVGDVEGAGFEDPQPQEPEQAHQGEVVRCWWSACGGQQGFELQVAQAEGG